MLTFAVSTRGLGYAVVPPLPKLQLNDIDSSKSLMLVPTAKLWEPIVSTISPVLMS